MKTKAHSVKNWFKFAAIAPALFLAALITFCPLQVRAETIALSFTDGIQNNTAQNITRGWAFSLSGPVILTALGLWDFDNDGLFNSYLVTVWDSTGTQVAQMTVPIGTTGTLEQGFRYVALNNPVFLAAGNYTIGAYYFDPVQARDFLVRGAATITTASGVTYGGSRSINGNAFPTGDPFNPTPNSYFGPNFKFTPMSAEVQAVNVSGRVFVQLNDKVGICGFIIQGGTGKRVVVRGLGPSLSMASPSIAGALQDPIIELRDDNGALLISNDNWRGPQENEIQQTGLAPTDNAESAVIATLVPGSYTAILRGASNSTGIGLVEVYDLQAAQGEFANVSLRAEALTDERVLILGLILDGAATPKRFLFRAIGPALSSQGITGALQNPTLAVHGPNGELLGDNDDWRAAANALEIEATGISPADDRESAVLITLMPANYTAIVRGVNGTTGIALAEVYRLPDLP